MGSVARSNFTEIHKMENSQDKIILRFLEEQESLTEQRLRELNSILDYPVSRLPDHITDTLNSLRQNAEEDLSNIYHIQSIYPSSARTRPEPKQQVEELQERVEGVAVADGDDLFTLEGVPPVY